MTRTLGLIVLALALLFVPSAAHASGDFNFVYGTRSLDHDFWDPVDDQEVYGATLDFGGAHWPVNIAIGYSKSHDDGTIATFPVFGSVDLDVHIEEYSLGIEKVWKAGKVVRPFVGGGFAYVKTDAKVDSVLGSTSDDDTTNGFYIDGGVFFRLGSAFNLGIDGRFMEGTDVTLFDQDGDADYWQIGGLLGFGW
jgi:Outer membrane protein beta-barrel domain